MTRRPNFSGWKILTRSRMRSKPKKDPLSAVTPNQFLAINILLLMGLGGLATAAVAPMSPEKLRIASTHILKGKVLEVKSRVEKLRVERAFGIHRDRVFTIMIQVTAVSKGKGVKRGEKVAVVVWQPATRIPLMPGPQGHSPVPEKGQVVTIHIVSRKGSSFIPFMPNGIRIEDARHAR